MALRGLGGRFNRLWAAAVAGNLGDGVYRVTTALLAARLTSDPVAFSLLTVLGMLPWLVLALPAGTLVDRYDRRRLALLVGASDSVLDRRRECRCTGMALRSTVDAPTKGTTPLCSGRPRRNRSGRSPAATRSCPHWSFPST